MADIDIEWSIRTWRERHSQGYFPNSIEHRDWKIYPAPPKWLVQFGQPTPDDQVLDIGCGYGEWMIPLAPLVRTIEGIDIHEDPIAVAARKFQEHGTPNCRAQVSDGQTIPFPADQFSLVYSISVFQHIPKKLARAYMHEAHRVTRVGGRGLFHLRNMNEVGPYPEPAQDIAADHRGDFSCGWTADEARAAGAAAGWDCRVEILGLFLVIVGYKK